MALYLKYRPQTLDQLLGQEQIKKTLISAYHADKLSHAYLFVGPRGTGKTSTARILAKMVNCEKQLSVVSRQSSENAGSLKADSEASLKTEVLIPCNQCSSCLSITDGSNLDLIEIDAASNRGIDDIRTLRENIKLSPAFSSKKVYIIDEVHMLTTEAFNALLKTLEEPPKHAFFILATTDAQKVPQTILSRVQRLDFKLASHSDLSEALKRIVTAEKIEIDDEALQLIIKRAEGSFRDGVKILDQMSSTGSKIVVSDVAIALQIVEFDNLTQLVEILAAKNASEALLFISANIVKGSDAKGWVVSLLDILRSMMLIKSGVGNEIVAPEYDTEKYAALNKLTDKFEIQDLVKALDLFQKTLEKMRFTSIPVLPLELAVVEICLEISAESSVVSHQTPDITVNKTKIEEQSKYVILSANDRVSPKASAVAQGSQDSKNPKVETITDSKPASDDAVNPEIALLQEKWNFVLETIKPYNFSLEALLRLVTILECSSGRVVLEVPYSFHQRILEAPKSRDLLESVLSDILGKPIRVSCAIAVKPMRAEDVANVEVAADDEIIRAAAEIFSSDSSN